MREIAAQKITGLVKELCQKANSSLPEDIRRALKEAVREEKSATGKEVLKQLQKNARVAIENKTALCQDSGMVVVFLDVGQDVHIVGSTLTDAVNEGVRQGYKEGYLRASVVSDPLSRKNTGDNTPAIIHTELVPGDKFKMLVAPKGAGSENMSGVSMLTPAEGVDGIKKFVLDKVSKAGAKSCPPLVIGVGIGGTMEKTALMAKRACLRKVGSRHPDKRIAILEDELKIAVNQLGIGPGGIGGGITALACHIEIYPCHMASLPVAVNLNCHACRHWEGVL